MSLLTLKTSQVPSWLLSVFFISRLSSSFGQSVFDRNLDSHVSEDSDDAADQVSDVVRKELPDVADPERVGVGHLAGVDHLICQSDQVSMKKNEIEGVQEILHDIWSYREGIIQL